MPPLPRGDGFERFELQTLSLWVSGAFAFWLLSGSLSALVHADSSLLFLSLKLKPPPDSSSHLRFSPLPSTRDSRPTFSPRLGTRPHPPSPFGPPPPPPPPPRPDSRARAPALPPSTGLARPQICRFCYHHIKENLNRRCPACRAIYDDETVEFKAIKPDEYVDFSLSLSLAVLRRRGKGVAQERKGEELEEQDGVGGDGEEGRARVEGGDEAEAEGRGTRAVRSSSRMGNEGE